MDYVVAIPSLKRSNLLLEKTYKLLKKHNIPDNMIYVFVIDNEYEEYKKALPNCNIVVGRFSAKNNKNYILDYFKDNQYILQLDDDIKDLYEAIDKKTLKSISNLDNIVREGFRIIELEKCNIYGVYPIKNAGFMFGNKHKVSQSLNYCCGAVLLLKNHRLNKRKLNLVEDFEFSLRNYIEFGKILRNNRICVEANQYTYDGGLQFNNNRNKQNKLIEIQKLIREYPQYVKLVRKNNGQPDIRFLKKKDVLAPPLLENIPELEEVIELKQQNELYTYYTGESQIPKYYLLCIESWLKLDYKVILLTNEIIDNLPEGIEIQNVEVDIELEPAQQADIVRYQFLLDNPNKIWIDLDMYLIRKIPNLNNIISSEQPNRTGAFKTDRENTPNIGILKLSNTAILEETLKKCRALKNTTKTSCYMKIFISLLSKYDLNKYVVPWRVYCPLDWSNVKEAFSGKPLKSKYGKEIIQIEHIKNDENIIGVHLWSSFIRKHNIKGHSTNSFIAFLCS